ncbi:hypothetical protein GCM10023175_46800 [Pseudonocardia xishanensis]|uniref:Uncharacterized protein n=1 Tax=Pseudonocardia xishanensis TaxID=630995 RepID=A0ABP8RWN6_9PSEU
MELTAARHRHARLAEDLAGVGEHGGVDHAAVEGEHAALGLGRGEDRDGPANLVLGGPERLADDRHLPRVDAGLSRVTCGDRRGAVGGEGVQVGDVDQDRVDRRHARGAGGVQDPGACLLHLGPVSAAGCPAPASAEIGDQVLAPPHHPDTVARGGDLGGGQHAPGGLAQRHDRVRDGLDRGCALGHRQHDDDVPERGERLEVGGVPRARRCVHAHEYRLGIESAERLDDVCAGRVLVLRADGVLEVEDHRVRRGERLVEAFRPVAGAEQQCGAAQLGHQSSPPRLTSWAAITLRWISLVPSPTIISGASRK